MEFDIDFAVYEKGKKAPQYTIDSDIAGEVSLQDFLQWTKAHLIYVADHALREEQAKGFDKDPVVSVDGRVGKPVINVNPLGSIEFTARQNMTAILREIYEGIMQRSPVDTGLYREGNYVFLNGYIVATSMTSFAKWINTNPQFNDRDVIRFVNVIPYARKLERLGVTSQRVQSRRTKSLDKKQRSGPMILAPNGVYFLTMRSVSRKYKFNSKIVFEIVPGASMGLQRVPVSTKTGQPLRRTYVKKGTPYLYPSIKIVVNEGGIK